MPPLRGCPSDYCLPVWCGKTRMMGLPDGEKSLTICLPILTECTNVTHRQTDTHTDGHRMTAKAVLDACIARQKSKSNLESTDGSRSPPKVNHFQRVTPCPWLPSFANVRFRVRQLSCLQNDRRDETMTENDHITSASMTEVIIVIITHSHSSARVL